MPIELPDQIGIRVSDHPELRSKLLKVRERPDLALKPWWEVFDLALALLLGQPGTEIVITEETGWEVLLRIRDSIPEKDRDNSAVITAMVRAEMAKLPPKRKKELMEALRGWNAESRAQKSEERQEKKAARLDATTDLKKDKELAELQRDVKIMRFKNARNRILHKYPKLKKKDLEDANDYVRSKFSEGWSSVQMWEDLQKYVEDPKSWVKYISRDALEELYAEVSGYRGRLAQDDNP